MQPIQYVPIHNSLSLTQTYFTHPYCTCLHPYCPHPYFTHPLCTHTFCTHLTIHNVPILTVPIYNVPNILTPYILSTSFLYPSILYHLYCTYPHCIHPYCTYPHCIHPYSIYPSIHIFHIHEIGAAGHFLLNQNKLAAFFKTKYRITQSAAVSDKFMLEILLMVTETLHWNMNPSWYGSVPY